MAFYVGQKVVCVDDSPSGDGYRPPINVGDVYIICAINENGRGELGFYLDGIFVPDRPGFIGALSSRRFRPAVDRKTDISIFKAMLNHKTAGIDA